MIADIQSTRVSRISKCERLLMPRLPAFRYGKRVEAASCRIRRRTQTFAEVKIRPAHGSRLLTARQGYDILRVSARPG